MRQSSQGEFTRLISMTARLLDLGHDGIDRIRVCMGGLGR